MATLSEQTKLEMARGFLSKTPVGMSSTPEAVARMGTLMVFLHRNAVYFEQNCDGDIFVVMTMNGECFKERASPDFPSDELVARVALAERFGNDED